MAQVLAQIYPYGRAECGRTKIRGVGLPVRSGAETANTSIDGWPKASGSPTRFYSYRARCRALCCAARSGRHSA